MALQLIFIHPYDEEFDFVVKLRRSYVLVRNSDFSSPLKRPAPVGSRGRCIKQEIFHENLANVHNWGCCASWQFIYASSPCRRFLAGYNPVGTCSGRPSERRRSSVALWRSNQGRSVRASPQTAKRLSRPSAPSSRR